MNRISLFFLLIVAVIIVCATYNSHYLMMSSVQRSREASSEGVEERFFDVGDTRLRSKKINFVKHGGGDRLADVEQQQRKRTRQKQKQKTALFHVALTASASTYNRWQCRIMYYWYKQWRSKEGSGMGGFTRILHSGKPDDLMREIPTVVVEELPAGMDQGYVVLNRPWAFVQWLQNTPVEEDYIMMAEPDHIFVKPLPNLATDDVPAAFPFFYIDPKKHQKVIRKFYPEHKGPISAVDPIGNSPVIIKKSQLDKIAPKWMNISLQMKADADADKAFGWVLEMYAYAIASATHGIRHNLIKNFMIQPPWDLEVGDKYIIHYTYGCDYTMKGELRYGEIGEWRFDKRSYLLRAPPRNLPLPPPGVPQSVVTLVKMVNEATANIPDWEEQEEQGALPYQQSHRS